MPTALVTGADSRTKPIAQALRAAGADVVTVNQLDDDETTKASAGRLFDAYVQLPRAFEPSGDTVVSRVRHFLAQGLLTRFTIVESVLPRLAPGAVVILVAGNLPPEVAAPDDQQARLSLLRVLAHAIRADRSPDRVRVRVLPGNIDPADIATAALTGKLADPTGLAATQSRAPEMTYDDWRTEILGLMSVET